MEKKRIAFFTSEATPFIKTGGLADVAGSLPKAIDSRYYDVRIFLPKYHAMKEGFQKDLEYITNFKTGHLGREVYAGVFTAVKNGIRYYFIDNEEFFAGDKPYGDWGEDISKFCFFEKAALMALKAVDFRPKLIHCHDWQAGLVPCYLREFAKGDSFYEGIKTVFTIHNLKFQGRWKDTEMQKISGLPGEYFGYDGLEYYGDGNMLKGALEYSDAVTTVSKTYAEEIKTWEYGEGLDGRLRDLSGKLRGIVNGIDTEDFDPAADDKIFKNYSAQDFRKKKVQNKLSLQRELGLPEDGHRFTAGIVSRLTDQKGFDLLIPALEELLTEDFSFVLLGTGDPGYEGYFRDLARRYPDKVSANITYSDALSRKIYAGCDAYLMPSRFEPCGLSQLIALRYGTLPVVRETGGLKDTVVPYNRFTGEGTGFSFANYDAGELTSSVRYAMDTYYHHKVRWNRLCENAMNADWSWKTSALSYQELYDWLIGY